MPILGAPPAVTRMTGPGFASGLPTSAHAAVSTPTPFSPSGNHLPFRASSRTESTLPCSSPADWRFLFGGFCPAAFPAAGATREEGSKAATAVAERRQRGGARGGAGVPSGEKGNQNFLV